MFVYCLSKLITEVVCMSTQMSTNKSSKSWYNTTQATSQSAAVHCGCNVKHAGLCT